MKNDIVIMNPPYSLKYSKADKYKVDTRFLGYPLAPKSKSDFMFVLDGLAKLEDDGIMVVLLPHGVLFRQGDEYKIRRKLLEDGNIAAIIGLPEKLFTSTDIPTVVLVLQKTSKQESVLFVDASKDFKKGQKMNFLEAEHIEKIVTAYKNAKSIDKYSRMVPLSEIAENDYNCNIPRYIDTFEEPDPVNLGQLAKEIAEIDIEIYQSFTEFYEFFKDLVGTTEEAEAKLKKQDRIIQDLIKQSREKIKQDALDMAVFEEAEKKVKESHIEEDGLPSDEYQQMTIEMLEHALDREEQAKKTIEVAKDLKESFMEDMFPKGK